MAQADNAQLDPVIEFHDLIDKSHLRELSEAEWGRIRELRSVLFANGENFDPDS